VAPAGNCIAVTALGTDRTGLTRVQMTTVAAEPLPSWTGHFQHSALLLHLREDRLRSGAGSPEQQAVQSLPQCVCWGGDKA